MGSPMGQHFLRDESVLEDIAGAAEITKEDLVIEVGGGKGQLTKHLITRAKMVLCVELDEDLVRVLSFTKYENLKIISGNILEVDLKSLIKENGFEKAIVIGNIPYYLTSPLVVKLIENIKNYSRIVFLIQREVAERLCAKPGTKDYSSLSIFTQFYTDVEIIGFVGREKFKPPPKVESAIVKLSVRENPLIAMDNEEAFFSFVRKSFQFRRKKAAKVMAGHLQKEKADVEKVFGSLGLDTNLRAEDLSAGDFYRLFKSFQLSAISSQ